MKKMINLIKELDLSIIMMVVTMVIIAGYLLIPSTNKEVENVITDQDIAEFAVSRDQNYYEGIVEVKINNVEYNEKWGYNEICFYVYVDGELKACEGINKDLYLELMEQTHKDS